MNIHIRNMKNQKYENSKKYEKSKIKIFSLFNE